MKIFANRNIWKKIVIIFSLIFSMSFVEPAPVKAVPGGDLMGPVCDLLVGLGDGIMALTQQVLIGQEASRIVVDLTDGHKNLVRWIATIVAVALVLVVAGVLTGGIAFAAGSVVAAVLGETATVAIASTVFSVVTSAIVPTAVGMVYFGVMAYRSNAFETEKVLPLYSISPEKIFSNTYAIFDVNFFNPNIKPYEYDFVRETTQDERKDTAGGKYLTLTQEEEEQIKNLDFTTGTNITDEVKNDFKKYYIDIDSAWKLEYQGNTYVYYKKVIDYGEGWAERQDNYRRINDGSGAIDGTIENEMSQKQQKYAYSKELQNTVKAWYSIIRTLAIVGMMSVLVYIGIRILISSTSEQKAKHKQLLQDWLVGMVLLFTMQYIMVFANIAVDNLTKLFITINPMGQSVWIPDDDDKVEKELREWRINVTGPAATNDNSNGSTVMDVYKFTYEGGKYIEWNTDLMGQIRISLQTYKNDSEKYIGYTIMFCVMVIYTLIFCFTYIKRVIYMAFLTIISPLVALTYPIDKANDGSAQGFNYWFKEYIFNLLIQPIHLLIYTILVSSAIRFASTNMIYTLVALGFITQAEKIVRAMFNFNKASTPGVFAGPAGAAIAMSGMRWLMGHGPKGTLGGGKSSGTTGGSNSNGDDATAILKTNKDKYNSNEVFNNILGSAENNGEKGTPTKMINNIVEGASDEATGNEPGALSFLERMKEAEYDEIPYMPDTEQLQVWDNDTRNGNNHDEGMTYSDEERRQILREGGASDEEIEQILGPSNDTMIRDNTEQIENEMEIGTEDNIQQEDPNLLDTSDESETNNGSDLDNDTPERETSFGRALKATAEAYGEGMRDKIAGGLQNARPGRAIGKAMGAALGAAFFGTAGVAIGVASGDMKSVVTDGIAGAAGGAKVGSGAINAVTGALSVDGLGKTFTNEYFGDKELEKIASKNREKLVKSKEWQDKIREKNPSITAEDKKKLEGELQEFLKYNPSLSADECIKLNNFRKETTFKDNKTGKNDIQLSVPQVIEAHKNIAKHGISSMYGEQDRKKRVQSVMSATGLDEQQAGRVVDISKKLDIFMKK